MKFFKHADYAPGIPSRNKSDLPTDVRFSMWDYSIQEHEAEKAGLHWDLRLSDGQTAYSFVLHKAHLPAVGERLRATRTFDHTPKYMTFSGNIDKGYGKGSVKLVDSGKAEMLKIEPNKISFNIYKGAKVNQYHLINTASMDWLIINNTPTNTNTPIPVKKVKARSIKPSEINFKDEDTLLMPKVDGAASVFYLKKDKPIQVFSYRRSKRGPALINRTYKYPDLYKTRVPKELDNTILWGESFVSDKNTGKVIPHRESSGLLNMGVLKAREKAQRDGLKFDNVIFNVDRFKGKDYSSISYDEKLKILKEITTKLPQLKIPEIAKTEYEKQKLYDRVIKGDHPQTGEGFVVWNLKEKLPTKAKIKKDKELYFQGVEKGTGKFFKSMGKILATVNVDGTGPVIRVGSGFSDSDRKTMWENKDQYMGRPFTVEYQEELPSGKLRMPIFKLWRNTEFWPT